MHVTVRLFALIREKAGTDSLALDLPDGAAVNQAIEALRLQHPALEPYLDNLRFSLRMDFVEADTILRDGDEVVLIPPVSGGSGCSA
ncbi:MAG: MoaD/ThiS family protein [Candidatus Tectomicrobia bacterium]|nr:MoaD/ThiS family protein [Candidatus Tectomicrobia bacterium]